MVKDNKENLKKCICENCPTYNECMGAGKEGLFCAREKSSCSFSMNGCLCGDCPVAKENNLSGSYHCDSGKEE